MPIKALFSLIQFVPDQIRDERINIAVVMQVPELNYVGIRVRPYMDRALRQLWPEVDAELVRHMVRAIEADLKPLEREPSQSVMEAVSLGLVEKTTPLYLDRFTQTYGPLKISPARPTRVRDGMSMREKLDQLFSTYVRVSGNGREVQNITKDIINLQLFKALDAREVSYQPNVTIQGRDFPNRFDIRRPRLNQPQQVLQSISFDNEKVDQPIAQCQRLIQAVHDVLSSSPSAAEQIEFSVALQAPVHYPQHRDQYAHALTAIRRTENFRQIFMNVDAHDTMTRQIVELWAEPRAIVD